MENHPIPQDVTGFQFKLIGDMTIKQFAYLASGVIMGWIFFSLPIPPLIKIPIVAFFVILGVALAFFPVAGRPLDIMLGNFIKAMFNPTQFIYQKTSSNILFPSMSYNLKVKSQKASAQPIQHNPKIFLQALPKMPKNKLDEKETNFFNSLFGQTTNAKTFAESKTSPRIISANLQDQPKSSQPKIASSQDTPEMLQKKALLLEKELESAKKEETLRVQPITSVAPNPSHQKVLDLEAQLQEVLRGKEMLTQQIISLQQKLGAQNQQIFTPTTATAKQETKNVRKIPTGLGKTIGLPIAPEIPNLITGIIKNPREQPLPNILVEVKDSEGNAVRAFKTNGIGQFASATPLTNGIYTLTFEGPTEQNKFDSIEFTANGSIILPIEVISVDTREELRRSLFSQDN